MIEDYIFDSQFVVHAGGIGERWKGVSLKTPKPLTKVGKVKKPIIEYAILPFINFGVKKFYITLYYKINIFKKYLEKIFSKYKIEIEFLEEKNKRLGRLGIVKKSLEEGKLDINKNIISMNASDILIFDIKKAFDFHFSNLNIPITIVASKNFKTSFGILEVDEKNKVIGFEEKPFLNFFTNTAFYIIDKSFNKKILEMKINYPKNFEEIKEFWENSKVIALVEHGKTWFPFKDLKDYREFGNLDFLFLQSFLK
ncbi:MAG: sugar phosphate nucleotidyltransferase [Candidatus Aenigmarchaeota archaeon]|nr:sugar phosphate nucleotidyltransferase [Candidatus Aenigmarchaeota archaeon]MDW8149319.1 sugar phosphate nucleotidyltransferase [Candidatus Aenigmarchaeota archaeon]